MSEFIISCESTVDMPYSYMEKRGVPVLFYSYTIDGKAYEDDMDRHPASIDEFYKNLEEGHIPTTSQINQFQYEEFFRRLLKEGKDVLHIAFGTGMTKAYFQALEAQKVMKKEFPKQKLVVIDSLCSSSGYGMLVDDALDLRDEGKSMEEIEKYVIENRTKIHHQFYSTTLKYYRRTGRMSGPASVLGSALKVCPIMRLNKAGKIIAYTVAFGRKNAIKKTIETMKETCDDGEGYHEKCFICHSYSPKEAEFLKEHLEVSFPSLKGKIRIYNIGSIIASHAGPGTVAVFYHGNERPEMNSKK